MLKISRGWVFFISGLFMLASGSMLLNKGAHYMADAFASFSISSSSYDATLLRGMAPLASLFNGSAHTGLALLLALAALVGLLKGQFVMKKVVNRSVLHVEKNGGSVSLFRLFPRQSLIIIGSMMLLGIAFNKFGLPLDVRGVIDFAIGLALVRGGIFYFREIWMPKLRRR
ncbi:hypothetical protein COB21_01385 [Candidatus Aerophobetes bacterium]|uniref:Uncharacterized protein n=1 Tax=Aerophobetes bacterium TaxID=2030807 RepID=A0A2A4X684_UNCAE|nr:MAG: hypothetical protein COB21_01385 [Candidatus Aerophobetes bacterium]